MLQKKKSKGKRNKENKIEKIQKSEAAWSPSPVLCHCYHRTAEQRSAGGSCAGRRVAGGCRQARQSGWLDRALPRRNTPAWNNMAKSEMYTIYC